MGTTSPPFWMGSEAERVLPPPHPTKTITLILRAPAKTLVTNCHKPLLGTSEFLWTAMANVVADQNVCLGVASHIMGNVLFEIMQLGHWGSVFADQIKGLSEDLNSWYRMNVPKINRIKGKLTIDKIRTKNGWPKLSAKAAATRHLAHYALSLTIRFGTGSTHDRQRHAVVELLCRILRDHCRRGYVFVAGGEI